MKMRWAADAPPWAARAEAVIARDLGFFREAGIDDADIQVLPGEDTAVQALLDGKVDFVSGLARKAFIAHAGGAPIRIIAISKDRLRAGLAVHPSIGDPKNLRGRTIAVGIFGAVVERLAKMSVEILGVDPGEVQYVEGGTGSRRIEAIKRGEVQAAIMMNSHLEAARLAGLTVYETMSDRFPKYAFHVISTTVALLNEQPRLVRAMLEGCVRGHRMLEDDTRVAEIAPLFTAQVPGGGREEWEAERRDVLKSCAHDLRLDDEALAYAVRFEQEWGLLPPDYDYHGAVDPAPLVDALAKLAGVPAG